MLTILKTRIKLNCVLLMYITFTDKNVTKTTHTTNIATCKNGLVKSSKIIDYENIRWPRDALYIPYTYPEEFKTQDEKEPYKVNTN